MKEKEKEKEKEAASSTGPEEVEEIVMATTAKGEQVVVQKVSESRGMFLQSLREN